MVKAGITCTNSCPITQACYAPDCSRYCSSWVPQISQLSTNVFIIPCFMFVVLVFLICVMKTYEEDSYREHLSVCSHVTSLNWTTAPVLPLETSLCTIFWGLLSLQHKIEWNTNLKSPCKDLYEVPGTTHTILGMSKHFGMVQLLHSTMRTACYRSSSTFWTTSTLVLHTHLDILFLE